MFAPPLAAASGAAAPTEGAAEAKDVAGAAISVVAKGPLAATPKSNGFMNKAIR
jgi:hypothetical protein